MVRTALAVLALASGPAASAPIPDLDQSFSQLRRDILDAHVKEFKAKKKTLARNMELLAREVRGLQEDAAEVYDAVNDLRGRALGQDASFGADLRDALWKVRDLARSIEAVSRRARRLSGEASRDSELVAPAEALERNASALRIECQALDDLAQWATPDIRRAGFGQEAWDLQRETSSAWDSARHLAATAHDLAGNLRLLSL